MFIKSGKNYPITRLKIMINRNNPSNKKQILNKNQILFPSTSSTALNSETVVNYLPIFGFSEVFVSNFSPITVFYLIARSNLKEILYGTFSYQWSMTKLQEGLVVLWTSSLIERTMTRELDKTDMKKIMLTYFLTFCKKYLVSKEHKNLNMTSRISQIRLLNRPWAS